MAESKAGDFHRAKQSLIENIGRFADLIPYLVEDSHKQIEIALLAGKLKRFTEITLRATNLEPRAWLAISETFNVGLARLERLIERVEIGFIVAQTGAVPFNDVAFAEHLISSSAAEIEAFIRKESPLERPLKLADLSVLLTDTEGGETTAGANKDLVRLIKGLVQALVALLKQGDQSTLARVLRALAKVLEALDQKFEGSAALEAEKKGSCWISVYILDAYIDNIDISKGWNFKFHINGSDYPVDSSADSVKAGLGYHFEDLKGKEIASFLKGKCGEEIDITVELTITENYAFSPASGKSNTLEYKVTCPGAKWGKHASVKLVDGSKTSTITVEPLIVLTCVHPEGNGGAAKGF